jgi:hypothetical protein
VMSIRRDGLERHERLGKMLTAGECRLVVLGGPFNKMTRDAVRNRKGQSRFDVDK